jgi:hypothetical protein
MKWSILNMNVSLLVEHLEKDEKLNEGLSFLEDIIVDKNKILFNKINEIISFPEKITNTNKFASLLVDLRSDIFIPNLINSIQDAIPGKTAWLADYMYALGSILDETADYYPIDESFVDLIGEWMLNTNGGEISWKASAVLMNLKNDKIFEYLRIGVFNQDLFHLTRCNCLNRLVNQFGKNEINTYKLLLNDKDKNFVQHVKEAIEFLENK